MSIVTSGVEKPKLVAGSDEWVEELFKYHTLSDDQQMIVAAVKEDAARLVRTIFQVVPGCADQTVAVRKVREATMIAVQAISLDGLV